MIEIPEALLGDFFRFKKLFIHRNICWKKIFSCYVSCFPFGFIFRALGGIPVDRSKSTNFVDSIAQLYGSREELIIFMAPEGTRRKVDKLKTGFYYIALQAKIPIIMIRLDFAKKDLAFSEPFYPTGKNGAYIIKN